MEKKWISVKIEKKKNRNKAHKCMETVQQLLVKTEIKQSKTF
jgi:CxxC motif-containing protein